MKRILAVVLILGSIAWLLYISFGIKVYHTFDTQTILGIKCENNVYYLIKGNGSQEILKTPTGQPVSCLSHVLPFFLKSEPHNK